MKASVRVALKNKYGKETAVMNKQLCTINITLNSKKEDGTNEEFTLSDCPKKTAIRYFKKLAKDLNRKSFIKIPLVYYVIPCTEIKSVSISY